MEGPVKLGNKVFLAPMMGITDGAFREAFSREFGALDGALSPFIRTLKGQRFTRSKFNDLSLFPAPHLPLVPQIMSNQADDMIHLARQLHDMGFQHINLNMGCPVPQTGGRGRGAGLLAEPDRVADLLSEVLSVLPCQLSIKTRLGFEKEDDLFRMVDMLNAMPLHSLMIHPRTALQGYSGAVRHEAFAKVLSLIELPVVYSGDINSAKDYDRILALYPNLTGIMLGRGLLRNPWLFQDIRRLPRQGCPGRFLSRLADHYRSLDNCEGLILRRLRGLMTYMAEGLGLSTKQRKQIKKAKAVSALLPLFAAPLR